MPIFIYEGGYSVFAPAMLVYRENTIWRIRKTIIRIFMRWGGYGVFVPAMLVLYKDVVRD